MDFRIKGLPADHFAHLFALSDDEPNARAIVRRIADNKGAYPCRVSLTDARPGDELLVLNYEHHAVDSPYRMRFAIFVRKGEETYDSINQVPEQLRIRTLAVRGFDAVGMITGSELVDGRELEPAIDRLFANPQAAYLHVHYAAPGMLRCANREGLSSGFSFIYSDHETAHTAIPGLRNFVQVGPVLSCAGGRVVQTFHGCRLRH